MTYFGLGVLLMFGLEALLEGFGGVLERPAAYAAQGVLGAGLLVYSLAAPPKPGPDAPTPRAGSAGGLFLLGVSVTVLEFPTAFPYLGAVGILSRADLTAAQWLPLLAAYNVVFVLPPLALLAAYHVFKARLAERFESLRERLQRGAREATLWVVGIVGFLLVQDALQHLNFFGLLPAGGAHGWLRLAALGHT